MRRPWILLGLAGLWSLSALGGGARWWKGNLHTHSLWSDGDDYPESIAAWYRDHGYNFLALSDHNRMQQGDHWVNLKPTHGGGIALERNRQRFGTNWLQFRDRKGTNQVRLKTLAEFRPLVEQPGRFLLIPSEEITGGHLSLPVHINATNLREPIPPQGGTNVMDVIQKVVRAVLDQRLRTQQPMFSHINHPNFGWGITAEDLIPVEGERFFEVYNGHPTVHNAGDRLHAGTDQVWDIVLAWRLGRLGLPPVFGLAVDDSHNYEKEGPGQSNSGRGWVMVRAESLTANDLVTAMEAGDFYASTGVTLRDVKRTPGELRIEVEPEAGVSYRTRFIGTRRAFNDTRHPVTNAKGEPVRATQRYHGDVGEVLAEVTGPSATYRFRGDELYVRARIDSNRPVDHPVTKGETATAWTQPTSP